MKSRIVLFLLALMAVLPAGAQQKQTTFEMRYFTKDPKADGSTDFHGETEWLDTDQRVDLLNKYAAYASRFWGDPGLDTPLFPESAVQERLARVKPQPLTSVRRTLPLKAWRAYGYKKGKESGKDAALREWTRDGAWIENGRLVLDGVMASPGMDPADWRFRIKAFLSDVPSGLVVRLSPADGTSLEIAVGALTSFEIYGDLVNGRIFLSSEGKTVKEIPWKGGPVTAFSIGAPSGKASVEALSFYRFVRQEENLRTPYRSELVWDEDFEPVPSMDGWQTSGYDDSAWEEVQLPSSHGGLKDAGESYYLRTRVQVDSFSHALLRMETLDPAGEVWINGEVAAVLEGRIPREIEIGPYLIPGRENTIAVRVKPYEPERHMLHAPSDPYIGWFLGRTELVLTDTPDRIAEALVHTASLEGSKAVQHHKITLRNDTGMPSAGLLQVNYYPWFPEEGPCVASLERKVSLRPRVDNPVEMDLTLDDPALWSPAEPRLYRVEVILKDENGKPVDDYVTTTGIRVIEQREGVLYINHRPEMLNGAQIMGFRPPVETISKTIRCATDGMVMRELMMTKALGNLLRIHVHAQLNTSDGINDPRYAEYADQLGLYLIWQTAGWIREGEAWNVDFSNYATYMRQVYNHPSIVMWEASNHPNRFKRHDFNDSEDFINQIVPIITETDSSRLVSPTSFWQHMHYANYDGTLDIKGGKHAPNPNLMHRMMTRGSQDSYTGYEKDWGVLRNAPSPWAKSCLEAKDLCYFNFEHEESIAQPNWAPARKEPWYGLDSYEKNYEKGTIGRLLGNDEWRASQGWQAFSAWESMKKQTLMGVSGFSWCTLESGPNMVTYQKPLVDPFGVPKLAFHANRMVFSKTWAGSDDVDVVYGPGDPVRPVIFNLGEAYTAALTVELQNEKGRVLERKVFKGVSVPEGRSVTRLEPFRFRNSSEGCRFLVYKLESR